MPLERASTPGNGCRNEPPPKLQLGTLLEPNYIFAPLVMAAPPGDASRLFVATRGGIVFVIEDGVLHSDPVLDISALTTLNSGHEEHGLLGMAFDPAFEDNRLLWLHYDADSAPLTSVTASVRILADDPNRADPSTLTTLFTVEQPASNHNGGNLIFGADGCLYLGFGDGGGGGDPWATGQDTAVPLGSLLRIDAATGQGAPGNPGYGDARIWSYGLRNPWRFSFDRLTGDLYIGDVGQDLWEEVDVEPAGTGDFNYGWSVVEGTHDYYGSASDALRAPLSEYSHDDGQSVTGGHVYRGAGIPGLQGRYLYADYGSNRYWVLTYAGEEDGQPQVCDQYEVTQDFGGIVWPTSFAEDARGELYVLTLGGGIYRIEPG
jgi:glucose/arabinose dehydrogenase